MRPNSGHFAPTQPEWKRYALLFTARCHQALDGASSRHLDLPLFRSRKGMGSEYPEWKFELWPLDPPPLPPSAPFPPSRGRGKGRGGRPSRMGSWKGGRHAEKPMLTLPAIAFVPHFPTLYPPAGDGRNPERQCQATAVSCRLQTNSRPARYSCILALLCPIPKPVASCDRRPSTHREARKRPRAAPPPPALCRQVSAPFRGEIQGAQSPMCPNSRHRYSAQ